MKKNIAFKKLSLILSLASASLISGCDTTMGDNYYPPAISPDITPPPKQNGSIYQDGYDIRLYDDRVARRVGDILTIRLEESTQGSSNGKTKTDKTASITAPTPTFFGKPMPFLNMNAKSNQSFDGKGESGQSNNLKGTISVTVTRVLPNRQLVIQGESWITINQSQEYVQLTGIVRPEDIQPNNIVSSQRVAAAQIKYGSKGQAGYASRGGIITQLFNRFAPY